MSRFGLLMIIKWRTIEPILTALGNAIVITPCNITRRGIKLAGEMASRVYSPSLSSDRLLHFHVVAIHLYLAASVPCLSGQARNNAISRLIVTRIDNADTALITHLLACSISIKDDDHPV